MKTSKVLRSLVTSLGISVLFATVAQAADMGPYASPTPIETWTGFSVGVGGGVGFLNSDVNAKASRTDGVGCAAGSSRLPLWAQFLGRSIKITVRASVSLAALGAFSRCKVHTTINLRRAGWWAVSSMQIGPMSAVMQNRQETLPSRSPAITLATARTNPSARLLPVTERSTQK